MSLEVSAIVRKRGFTLDARFTAPGDGVTALFGPSGAGKSLLLSALAGLARLDAGRVAFAGRVLEEGDLRVPAHARGIGLVFQDARLLPHLSVRGNLHYAAKRAPDGGILERIGEIAARFEIAALLDRPVRNLSGGEKSRVALARALLSAPSLLLLDEPFAALDGVRRRAFLQALRALHETTRLPMLVVTHQIEDAAAIADHIVGLKDGRVCAAGPLRETALTPAFQALLDERDVGAAIASTALRSAVAYGPAAWVRADQVLIATSAPQGLSARNVWPGVVRGLRREADGAVLATLQTEPGALLARVTEEAAAELALAEGKPAWAIVKAHAV